MDDSDWDEEDNRLKKIPYTFNGETQTNTYNKPKFVSIEREYSRRPQISSVKPNYMKRNNEDDRNGFITRTIEIDSKYAGRVIGKSGAKIKELKSQTNTYISVNDKVAEEGISNV
ncbi:hypothetical protein MXB_1639, partial [Myxobolus squamalis]